MTDIIRARYDGPHEEIAIFDPEADAYQPPVAVVQKGHYLPTDVPARIRDELTAGDYWTEVRQADQSKGKTDEKKDS